MNQHVYDPNERQVTVGRNRAFTVIRITPAMPVQAAEVKAGRRVQAPQTVVLRRRGAREEPVAHEGGTKVVRSIGQP
jgi:hypothetical protein